MLERYEQAKSLAAQLAEQAANEPTPARRKEIEAEQARVKGLAADLWRESAPLRDPKLDRLVSERAAVRQAVETLRGQLAEARDGRTAEDLQYAISVAESGSPRDHTQLPDRLIGALPEVSPDGFKPLAVLEAVIEEREQRRERAVSDVRQTLAKLDAALA